VKPRIGSVPYLNSLPLFQGVLVSGGNMTLMFDYPSNLAKGLKKKSFQAALCPTLLALQSNQYEILPQYGIISRGPVKSVHLYSKKDPKDWKSVCLDIHSMSSVALAEVLCQKHFKNKAEIVGLEMQDSADAYLLIGDKDMAHKAEEGVASYDLGEAWQELTGLPFLYAAWLVRDNIDEGIKFILNNSFVDPSDEILQDVLPDFLKNIPGLSMQEANQYLTENIHYTIDDEVWEGFNTFVNYLAEVRMLHNKKYTIAQI
jgi:chorismate dehydratase